MLLRHFRPADFETLYQIDAACFSPGVSYSREELQGFISHRNSKTWVAEESDEVAGFLVAQAIPGGAMHIITLDVREAWRRRGVASALMDAAEKWGRQQRLKLVSLETAEDNHAAQAFYQSRGYVKLGQVEGYYANGAAAWVMGKRLR